MKRPKDKEVILQLKAIKERHMEELDDLQIAKKRLKDERLSPSKLKKGT